jgi:hypothetical protein
MLLLIGLGVKVLFISTHPFRSPLFQERGWLRLSGDGGEFFNSFVSVLQKSV